MQVTVPSDLGNPIKIIVNGVSYSLGAGETVTVPDEVATELTRMLSAREKPAPAVDPPFPSGGSGGGGPLVVTLAVSGVYPDQVFTTDKTAREIAEALPNALFVVTFAEAGSAQAGTAWYPIGWNIGDEGGELVLNAVQGTINRSIELLADSMDSVMSSSEDT